MLSARIILAAMTTLLLAIICFFRSTVFEDDIRLYWDTVQKSPAKARPYNNLGDALQKAGKITEARHAYERAIALKRANPEALSNLASIYVAEGRRNDAIMLLSAAVALAPDYVGAKFNLAMIYYDLRMYPEAADLFRSIIQIAPDSHEATFARQMLAVIGTGRESR